VVDVCVTSVHKNLGSLSGTALINIGKKSRLSADLVKEIYIMLSTTSPSPYLLFDVEGCVRLMLDKGLDKFKSRLELRSLLTSLLKPPPTLTEEDVNASSSSIQIMSQDDAAQVVVVDMTKVVMKVDGLTGAQLYKRLDEKRIDIEKYT
jgi:arginine/lysine/ornithine decarboxylase